jgi:hypothetical protein
MPASAGTTNNLPPSSTPSGNSPLPIRRAIVAGSASIPTIADQLPPHRERQPIKPYKLKHATRAIPYYKLYDQQTCDLRQGFIYKNVPHVTLGSIANNEPAASTATRASLSR